MSYKKGTSVIINNLGKMEVGEIVDISRTTSSNIYYNVVLERGIHLTNVSSIPIKGGSFINKKITKLHKIS